MDTNQPTTTASTPIPPTYSSPPPGGMFGSKVPSVAAYAVAVLLFLMPFVDIKCNEMKLQEVRGFELATGFKMKKGGNPYLDDVKTDRVDDEIQKATTQTDKEKPNLYAMIALGLGVLGLLLSLTNVRTAVGGATVIGVAAAGAMIGLMLDIKKKAKMDIPDLSNTTPDNDVGNTIDKIGNEMKDVADKINITVEFTAWFYIAVVAFLAAAFFCWRRLSVRR